MVRAVVMPYLTTEAVQPEPWVVEMRGERQTMPDVLKGWDYQTPLRFESTVRVDRSKVLADCGLPVDAVVHVVARWSASSTNTRVLGAVADLAAGGEVTVALTVPPGEAGGVLTLRRMLVLTRPGRTGHRLAAKVPGAVLWREVLQHDSSCVLEGEESRFPTELVDFETSAVGDPNGLWWLRVYTDDLDASAAGAVRVLLNSGHEAVRAMQADRPDSVGAFAQKVLYWDVSRQLVIRALDCEELVDRTDSLVPGSVGEMLHGLVARLWPERDFRNVVAMRAQSPDLFDAKLQARIGLLQERA